MGGMPGATPQPGMPMGPGPTQPGPAPTGMVRVVVRPTVRQVGVGGAVTAELVAEGPEIGSGLLVVQFPLTQITMTNVSPSPGVTVVDMPNATSGKVTLQIQSVSPGRPLATFTFQAVGPGGATIVIPQVRLLNKQGQELNSFGDPSMIEITAPRAELHPAGKKVRGAQS